MGSYEDRAEMERHIAELKQLLDGPGLPPEVRARSLAALIEAAVVTQAADQVHSAATTTLGDAMPLLLDAVRSFGEKAERLAWAMQRFDESANQLSASLQRLPEY
jgi:hypothetical protein